ncbi:hypothetical protein OESDEN_13744 [Oesophagostomum dentatum]|uniref:Uncharacterized protein n=1 Tax=Oesophagostomum dentatum TaxID=61180 RepID=A0A0B1SSK3_OESDE|nr:hypothetical protein OESDEN_13744 [Oesophagostomum dentatum]
MKKFVVIFLVALFCCAASEDLYRPWMGPMTAANRFKRSPGSLWYLFSIVHGWVLCLGPQMEVDLRVHREACIVHGWVLRLGPQPEVDLRDPQKTCIDHGWVR